MKEVIRWNLSSDSNLVLTHPDGSCSPFDLRAWTRLGGAAEEDRPMTQQEVKMVTDILLKTAWPFDQPHLALVVSAAGYGSESEIVAVTLNSQRDHSDLEALEESRIVKVLWEASKSKPTVVVSADEAHELDAGSMALTMPNKYHPRQIQFSVNTYDQDGDCQEKGVFLWFGNTRVLVAETPEDFIAAMPAHMEKIAQEIGENYNLRTGRPL